MEINNKTSLADLMFKSNEKTSSNPLDVNVVKKGEFLLKSLLKDKKSEVTNKGIDFKSEHVVDNMDLKKKIIEKIQKKDLLSELSKIKLPKEIVSKIEDLLKNEPFKKTIKKETLDKLNVFIQVLKDAGIQNEKKDLKKSTEGKLTENKEILKKATENKEIEMNAKADVGVLKGKFNKEITDKVDNKNVNKESIEEISEKKLLQTTEKNKAVSKKETEEINIITDDLKRDVKENESEGKDNYVEIKREDLSFLFSILIKINKQAEEVNQATNVNEKEKINIGELSKLMQKISMNIKSKNVSIEQVENVQNIKLNIDLDKQNSRKTIKELKDEQKIFKLKSILSRMENGKESVYGSEAKKEVRIGDTKKIEKTFFIRIEKTDIVKSDKNDFQSQNQNKLELKIFNEKNNKLEKSVKFNNLNEKINTEETKTSNIDLEITKKNILDNKEIKRMKLDEIKPTIKQEVIKQANFKIHNPNKLTIMVNPDELGKVEINIEKRNGVINVQIKSEDIKVQEKIDRMMESLKDEMKQKNIDMEYEAEAEEEQKREKERDKRKEEQELMEKRTKRSDSEDRFYEKLEDIMEG